VLTQSLSDQSQKTLLCQGVFPFIGLEANTNFLPIEIQLDGNSRVLTNEKLCSTLPNIWAIGAVRAGGNGLLSDAIEDANLVSKNIISQLKQ